LGESRHVVLVARGRSVLALQADRHVTDLFSLDNVTDLSVSPDGEWLAVCDLSGLKVLRWGQPDELVAEFSPPRKGEESFVDAPRWDRTGQRLCFLAKYWWRAQTKDNDGTSSVFRDAELWLWSQESGEFRRLEQAAPEPRGRVAAPDWQPNGTTLLFTQRGPRVARLDLVTGKVEDLGPGRNPFWASTSEFGYEDKGAYYVRELAGGPPTRLFRVPGCREEITGEDQPPVWSYDASLLAYFYTDKMAGTTSIWVKTRDGRAGRIVVPGYMMALCLVRDNGDAFTPEAGF